LTIHIIGYRLENYSWTGEQSVVEAKCLAERNNGLYITAESEDDLVAAFEKTLDCPMTSQRTE
jgi:Ca-activated chloride channel family protein